MAHFYNLKVSEVRKETPDAVSVVFDIPADIAEHFQFVPGQYLTLKAKVDGQEVRRSYSICSAPFEGKLRLGIKRVEGGAFSTFATKILKKGMELDVMPPTGHFTVPINSTHTNTYVALVAGSGITPVLSIIKSILKEEKQSNVILFYGNKTSDSVLFKEEIEGLKNIYVDRFAVHFLLTQEKTQSELFNGRITAEKCAVFFKRLIPLAQIDTILLCGPEEMIFEIQDWLAQQQYPKEHIKFELFTTERKDKKPYVPSLNSEELQRASKISIKLDGHIIDFELAFGGDTILEAALKAGADLPFACKGGVCCTCKAKLVEGKVDMEVNYALVDEEVNAGYILTCQSHPRTEQVVIDFDQ